MGVRDMVDVGAKPETERSAEAVGRVRMKAATLQADPLRPKPKGDVLRTAELAGIMAAKRTAELIPLVIRWPLTSVDVTATANARRARYRYLAPLPGPSAALGSRWRRWRR